MSTPTTDFGFKEIPVEEKQSRVNDVFHSVASRYDLMNDLMSLGIHRLWKRQALSHCQIRPSHQVLDLASGTGDFARLIAPRLNSLGRIVLSDINHSMLSIAQKKLIDHGILQEATIVQANAQTLPFSNNTFDRVIMGFGLRNVTHKDLVLHEVYRVLKPGGRFVILEFSHPVVPILSKLYDQYSFHVLPTLGQWVAQDEASYRYLAESIRRHPNQETLKNMMLAAQFDRAEYQNLTGGIVAIHKGIKYG